MEITWEKDDYSGKTRFLLDGEEIVYNPGQVFIHVVETDLEIIGE